VKRHAARRLARSKKSGIRVQPREFVFIDRKTGKKRFAVKPARDGGLPVEETSSLLAVHCVLRSQTPVDFRVMVAVGSDLLDCVLPRTKELIAACSPQLMPIQITARQQQVLRGILQNLRNKEIAAGMNVAERTVKFHVAALLEKFHVRTRLSLTQKLDELMAGVGMPGEVFWPQIPLRIPPASPRTLRPAFVRLAGEPRAGR
jgi:DNA-binding CsgD family transcriptional regulator